MLQSIAELSSARAAGTSSTSVTFTIAPYPYLTLQNLSVTPNTGLTSGSQFTISWNDVNLGNAAVTRRRLPTSSRSRTRRPTRF